MKFRSLASFLLPAVALFVVSLPVFAHTWFCGPLVMREEHLFTVQGTVLEFEFVNPHSAIIFEAKDKSGATQRWHAELGGANALHRADGWDRDTLKPGDKITIIGPRNKNGSNDMNLFARKQNHIDGFRQGYTQQLQERAGSIAGFSEPPGPAPLCLAHGLRLRRLFVGS